MKPSSRSHIYRMILVLVVIMAGFVVIRSLAIPKSWDNELFYRVDSLEELKHLPLRLGGNESCAGSACHEQQLEKHKEHYAALENGDHSGLACENCHGPLSAHVSDGRRIAPARIEHENSLCLGCHAPLISRPKDFPQFDAENTGHWYFDVEIDTPCQECHDPHEPRHMAVVADRGVAEDQPATGATKQPHVDDEEAE